MAEINNNIPSFGFNKKVEIKPNTEPTETVVAKSSDETTEPTYAPDPGVLGRSQVKRANGANIEKTVKETCAIATKNPTLMHCSEGVFDTIYNDLISRGMNESDAYMTALMAEEELLEICPHN